MFQPKFQLLLKKENFYPDEVICLGSQLITIVNFLQKILPQHIWYVADIESLNITTNKIDLNSFSLNKIGDDLSFLKYCSQINQFLSGVFLAIDDQNAIQKIENLEVRTEDRRFRPLAIDGVLIEIRAFDTSFFEVYSENENIMIELANDFGVEIIKSSYQECKSKQTSE